MGYKIGIDFGTTYSKIAYLDEQGSLKLFRYPGPPGKEYIPTAVAYRTVHNRQTVSVGEAARSDVLNHPEVRFCENFKMLLPLEAPEQWRAHGWPAETSPEDVTQDYLHSLLHESQFSFERLYGSIENLVVSVPEVWQRAANNPGAEALRRIVTEALRLPLDHLRSEPVCAAAYYVYRYQQDACHTGRQAFNLLVCDIGGGTFDVALCRVSGQQIDPIRDPSERDTTAATRAQREFPFQLVLDPARAHLLGP